MDVVLIEGCKLTVNLNVYAEALRIFQANWTNQDCWPSTNLKCQVERGSLWMECSIPKKRVAIFQHFWKVVYLLPVPSHWICTSEAIFCVQLLMAVLMAKTFLFKCIFLAYSGSILFNVWETEKSENCLTLCGCAVQLGNRALVDSQQKTAFKLRFLLSGASGRRQVKKETTGPLCYHILPILM